VVEGDIEGSATDGLTLKVEVVPTDRRDITRSVQYPVKQSHFRVAEWFNTTSNVVRRETCNRTPSLVIVTLLKGHVVLDKKTLMIETDFRRSWDGDFEISKPTTLHAEPVK
jgi:hypothetical protein